MCTSAIAEDITGGSHGCYIHEGHPERALDHWVRCGGSHYSEHRRCDPAVGWEEIEELVTVARGSRTREYQYTRYFYVPAGWSGAPYGGASSASGSLEEERHLRAARQAFADVRRAGGSAGSARAAAAPHIRHALDVRRHVESIRVQVEQSLDESIAAEAALMATEPDTAAWDRALERRIRASARSAAWRRAALTGALTDTLAALAA